MTPTVGRCRVLVTIALSALAFAAACGNPNGPRSGINIVSGANLSDTVLSAFKPPLTIVLLDGDLQPMAGQTVYFNTNGFLGGPKGRRGIRDRKGPGH